ncbi:thioredoxin-dependent thiol peroxidase [candidate division KSB1 bacterium]|nr:thioredoxin-dependent thiol peroxidase [candidate division KSB1 bacterium]
MAVETGKPAPEFCLPNSDGQSVCLKDLIGQWIVLYFYPKDNTSGCTLEAIAFTQQIQAFTDVRTIVLGVSPDSQKSHCNFRDKHDLKVTLLSDPEKEVLQLYGVWVKKSMYGREYMGVERSTFLIDPNGVIAAVWKKVKVKGHVEAVLQALKEHA